MTTFTFTPEQFEAYSDLIQGLMDYQGTHDSPPVYEEWLEETFGEDWLDYQLEYNGNLYEYEFQYDFYYGLVVGDFSQDIKDWIDTEKENYKNYQEEKEKEEE